MVVFTEYPEGLLPPATGKKWLVTVEKTLLLWTRTYSPLNYCHYYDHEESTGGGLPAGKGC